MKRAASHAGSWYTVNNKVLNKELNSYFDKATKEFAVQGQQFPIKNTRAIIGPHAGFSYSGPTAAFAYKAIDTTHIKRVFILGPSHHAYIDGCSLSKCDEYETPFGNLTLDKEVIKELYETGKFNWMKQSVDEDEHSIEMHLPFTYKIFEDKINQIKVVPILVGSISERKETMYGELLAPYLKDPENLFIISSDFCHWGARFRYTYYLDKDNEPTTLTKTNAKQLNRPIHESIQALDQQGIDTLEALDLSEFHQYLEETDNTICGRHPIAVLMASLETIAQEEAFSHQIVKCIKYAQSSPCKRYEDSSVSYASIYIQIN